MISIIHSIAYCVVALVVLTWVGNEVCRKLFKVTRMRQARISWRRTAKAGRLIGNLERIIIATGVIIHSWEIVAGVIALKTIARFKELDKEINAEYFLIGSLFSLLWAMLVSGLWLAYDHGMGNGLRAKAAELINPKEKDETAKRVQVQVTVTPVQQQVPPPKLVADHNCRQAIAHPAGGEGEPRRHRHHPASGMAQPSEAVAARHTSAISCEGSSIQP